MTLFRKIIEKTGKIYGRLLRFYRTHRIFARFTIITRLTDDTTCLRRVSENPRRCGLCDFHL